MHAHRPARRGVLCSLLLILTALPLSAQPVGPDYAISPGDALHVDVWADETLSRDYPVGPSGTINMPMLGQIHVAGLKMEEARELITERLKALVRDPQVVVSINETASVRQVYVLGFVERQGQVLLPFGASVVDALAAAGTNTLSDLAQVQLSRVGEPMRKLDLSGLRTGEMVPVGERVRWGDVLYVPQLDDRIAVLGQVRTPSSSLLPLGQKVTVLDALARLGGGLNAEASLLDAMLIHLDGTVSRVDLEALIRRGDTSHNLVLKPGDVLVVQEVEKISVVGEVNRPITFSTAEPVSLLQVLAVAGSFTPKADLTKARVISPDGTDRQVNIKALWEEGDLTQNVELRAGDVLLLPERPPENLLVVGAVAKAGIVNLTDVRQRDVLRIVTLAGPTPQSDLTRVHVYRGDERFTVNVERIMDEGALGENLELQLDDVVMVPERDVVYMLGAFNGQGKVPWKTGLTLTDAIATVGGLAVRANANRVTLVRTHADGETEVTTYRYGRLTRGEVPPPTELEPGDIVYCPFQADPEFGWRMLSNWLWLFNILQNILN